MISLVLPLLAATPYAQAFWERDLAALVGELAETPETKAEKLYRPFFGELVLLVDCEKLAPLEQGAPLFLPRLMLRAEELRRLRLGEQAPRSATVWKDIYDPGFFVRKDRLLGDDDALFWPVEDEKWPGERVFGKLKPSSCVPGPATASGDELAVLTPELIDQLDKSPGDAAKWLHARIAYQRTARLLEENDRDGAKLAAAAIDPELLEAELQAWGRLARVELGQDPAEGLLALVDAPALEPVRPALYSRAAAYLSTQRRFPELRALTEKAIGPGPLLGPRAQDPLFRDLVYRRALALRETGAKAELYALVREVFPAWSQLGDPQVEALRDVAADQLARDGIDERGLELFRTLAPPQAVPKRLSALGVRALELGQVGNALGVAAVLSGDPQPKVRARGNALAAEIAIVRGDAVELSRAFGAMLALRKDKATAARDRDEIDRLAFELSQALVLRAAALPPAWSKPVREQLTRAEQELHSRYRKQFEPLYAALDERPATAAPKGKKLEAYVAVGAVEVSTPLAEVQGPPAPVTYPELYSLLALPTDDGSAREWFPPEVRTVLPAEKPKPTSKPSEVSDAR